MKNANLLRLSILPLFSALGIFLILSGRDSMPKGAKPVTNLDINRYLGTWYEIARFDFRFEKDMDNTTAHYSLNDDGTVKVTNRGYNYKKKKWSESVGKAKFVKEPNVGQLKVSFFGPFYAPYNIIKLDEDYRYALIVGKNTDYLWFLSRTPQMPDDVKADYMQTAERLGFDLSRLIWVEHDQATPH